MELMQVTYAYTYASVYDPGKRSKIKFGGSAGSAGARVSQQVTGMPEQPIILRVFQTSNFRKLEKFVHSRLTRADDAPGTEWFRTTIEEIDALVDEFHALQAVPKKVVAKKSPRKHQVQAVAAIAESLKTNDRTQLVMATGTGKTLTCLWIAEEVGYDAALLLFPSIALASQTLQVWKTNAKDDFDAMVVCSDQTAGYGADAIDQLDRIDRNLALVTTDPQLVEGFLRKAGNKPKVVFGTYHSSPVIAEAAKGCAFIFDIAFADEAHRTAGNPDAAFRTILGDQISAKKRVFATATPRTFTTSGDDLVSVNCMSDESTYGAIGFDLNVRAAIDQGLLAPYRIMVVGLRQSELERAAGLNKIGDRVVTTEQVACAIAQQKIAARFKHRAALSFHSTNNRAEDYAAILPNLGLGNTRAESIDGKSKVADRERSIKRLVQGAPEAPRSLASCQVLSEGVDVPSVDLVVFADPKGSKVGIIQSVGRALRIDPVNPDKVATVLIGVPVPDDGGTSEIDRSAFRRVFEVVNALQSSDPNLEAEMIKVRKEKGRTGVFALEDSGILTIDLPEDYSEAMLDAVTGIVVGGVTSVGVERIAQLDSFVGEHRRMPSQRSDDAVEKSLGKWVNLETTNNRRFADQIRAVAAKYGVAPRKQFTGEERIAQLDAFVSEHKRMPSQSSKDPIEKSLGVWASLETTKNGRFTDQIRAVAAKYGVTKGPGLMGKRKPKVA
jgi:superfamily II DNA or RNA helicase